MRAAVLYDQTRTRRFHPVVLDCLDFSNGSNCSQLLYDSGGVLCCVQVSKYVAFNYILAHTNAHLQFQINLKLFVALHCPDSLNEFKYFPFVYIRIVNKMQL